MKETESRTLTDKFMLRMPDGMRDRIKIVAETNNRSMNSEIVATLEEKYPAQNAKFETIPEIAAFLNSLPEDERATQLELFYTLVGRSSSMAAEPKEAAQNDDRKKKA